MRICCASGGGRTWEKTYFLAIWNAPFHWWRCGIQKQHQLAPCSYAVSTSPCHSKMEPLQDGAPDSNHFVFVRPAVLFRQQLYHLSPSGVLWGTPCRCSRDLLQHPCRGDSLELHLKVALWYEVLFPSLDIAALLAFCFPLRPSSFLLLAFQTKQSFSMWPLRLQKKHLSLSCCVPWLLLSAHSRTSVWSIHCVTPPSPGI